MGLTKTSKCYTTDRFIFAVCAILLLSCMKPITYEKPLVCQPQVLSREITNHCKLQFLKKIVVENCQKGKFPF